MESASSLQPILSSKNWICLGKVYQHHTECDPQTRERVVTFCASKVGHILGICDRIFLPSDERQSHAF